MPATAPSTRRPELVRDEAAQTGTAPTHSTEGSAGVLDSASRSPRETQTASPFSLCPACEVSFISECPDRGDR
jgi:hypothetical protein